MSDPDEITTFSGFGSWVSSLTPAAARHTNPIHELPAAVTQTNPVHELPASNPPASPPRQRFTELAAEAESQNSPPHSNSMTPYSQSSMPSQSSPASPYSSPTGYQNNGANQFPAQQTTHRSVARPDPIVEVKLIGLQKTTTPGSIYDLSVKVSVYSTLDELANLLERHGYMRPEGFKSNDPFCALPLDLPTQDPQPLLVTDGPSSYQSRIGLRINRHEPFTSYLSRLQVRVSCSESRLVINDRLKIGFHRTLRVPEDGQIHYLPADFGFFPLQNVAAYSSKLQRSGNPSLLDIAKKSGVFFPMFQREAMWISFTLNKSEEQSDREYAIRVFVGGINVVSGRKWDDPAPAEQDYVIIPGQDHLDGIAVGRDVVSQFIAMPIGSGYSIEKQITGKEDIGGLQMEIIPTSAKLAIQFKPGIDMGYESLPTSATPTAAHYNLQSGTDIFVVKEGNGRKSLAGDVSETRTALLRELLPNIRKASRCTIAALYRSHVTFIYKWGPGGIMTQKIRSGHDYSPFMKVQELSNRVSDTSNDGLEIKFSSRTKPLDPRSTLVEAGIIGSQGLMYSNAPLPEVRVIRKFQRQPHNTPSWQALGGGTGGDVPMSGSYDSPPNNALSGPYTGANSHPQRQHTAADDAWTMGIAAGGRLWQQITRDWDIRRRSVWNKSAISMINVQVLNSVAFEAVSGMVTPPTPITLEAYKKAGIPFFSTHRNGAAATSSGADNFHGIKSVSQIDSSLGVGEGVSIAHSQRIACSACQKYLCDCVLRPCNHAFCSSCVYTSMTGSGKNIICRECHGLATNLLGFSAPMALPGEEPVLGAMDIPVVTLPGIQGKFGFVTELAG